MPMIRDTNVRNIPVSRVWRRVGAFSSNFKVGTTSRKRQQTVIVINNTVKTSNPTMLRHVSIGHRMAIQVWRIFRVGSLCAVGVNTNTTACMEVTSDVKQYGTVQSDVGVYIRGVWIRLPGIFTHGSACFPSRHTMPAVRSIHVIHAPLKQHWLFIGLVLQVFHMARCKQQHRNINILMQLNIYLLWVPSARHVSGLHAHLQEQ